MYFITYQLIIYKLVNNTTNNENKLWNKTLKRIGNENIHTFIITHTIP